MPATWRGSILILMVSDFILLPHSTFNILTPLYVLQFSLLRLVTNLGHKVAL
jgi:hypothetical protein